MIQHQTHQKPIHSLLDTEAQVYGIKQKNLTNNEYYEKFKDLVTNANQLGSNIGAHSDWVDTILANIVVDPALPTNAECKQAHDLAKEQYLVVMFLLNCDHNCYGNLVQDIENEYTHGTNMYLASLSATYDYIMNY